MSSTFSILKNFKHCYPVCDVNERELCEMPYLWSFVWFIHCVKLFSAFQLEYVQYSLTSVASEKAGLQEPQANILNSTLSPCV